MNMYWYNIPQYAGKSLDEVKQVLAPLGVVQRETLGRVHYWVDDETGQVVKSIGEVLVRKATGVIEVWPYAGVDERAMVVLYGSAEHAFRNAPSRAQAWHFRRPASGRSYWRSIVNTPADPDDPVRVLIARSTRSVDEEAELSVTHAADQRTDA